VTENNNFSSNIYVGDLLATMRLYACLTWTILVFGLNALVITARRVVPGAGSSVGSGGVMVALTDDNYTSYIDANPDIPVLVSFCTTTSSCMEFTTNYRKAAEELLNNIQMGNIKNMSGIVIAHCDISENPILVKRFDVKHMPTLYFHRKGRAYMYSKRTTKTEIINFILYRHLELEPLGLLVNPFGIVGKAKALKAFLYMNSRRLLPMVAASTGLSPLAVLLSTIVSGSVLLLIISFTINYVCI
jgi:hypothetical protein